jgi:hypothetical protein
MEVGRAARCGRLVLLLGVRRWGVFVGTAWTFIFYGSEKDWMGG